MSETNPGKKNHIRKENVTGLPPAGAKENPPPPASTPANNLSDRESRVLGREDKVLGREDKVLGREDKVLGREDTALDREDAVLGREEETSLREGVVDLREETADRREKALRASKKAAKDSAALSLSNQENLREANESLVVAAVNALTMKEAAEKSTADMAHMAEHDVLTGLPNRTLLNDRLAQSIALAQRYGKNLALMYLDLDNFKRINDSLGHTVGDHLLQSAAKRLQGCVRLSDTICRQGGDEFVVLLSEVEGVRDTTLIAEKLINAMVKPHFIDGHRLRVTLSIGISMYPDDGKDVDTLFRNADAAMYHAKKTGRNNYQMFTADMNDRAATRQSVEKSLHRALEHRGFVLHYQPKVDLETGAITGAEALIRMQQANHKLALPKKFVNIAEECGLIRPIGRWALREACRQTQAWLQAGLDIGQIAVNVSARELQSIHFLEGVHAILDETGLAPGRLQFELTESELMQDMEQTIVVLQALKGIGIQIAVDKFGTGYSSLNFLMRFPIDTIKIDQSCVQKINGNGGDAFVSAAIAIGKSLKQRVVAEGIETQQQLTFLKSHKCPEGQGYYFCQPMPAGEFATLLATGRHIKRP